MVDVGCLYQKQAEFCFVLLDIWFLSKENMRNIKEIYQKDFVCALNANRLAAISAEDCQNNRFISIENLPWQEAALFFKLAQRRALSCTPRAPELYQQRWKHGYPLSGLQRYNGDVKFYSKDLSKTMAVRSLP